VSAVWRAAKACIAVKIPRHLEAAVRELSRLPGIGPKSASRLAFHVLKMSPGDVKNLTGAINSLRENVRSCLICGGIADDERCEICADPSRDRRVLCVVEGARDVITIEKTNEFNGLYHVLQGVISPLDGIGPEDLAIRSLVDRCAGGEVREIIIATNPTVEGDATGLYIARLIKPLGIRVMRIAHGLPVGSDLEFADSVTIAKSLAGRVEL